MPDKLFSKISRYLPQVIALLFVGVLAVFGFYFTKNIEAGTGDNVSGFAWSENIGWISLNNTSGGGTTNYGVNISPTTGVFSGHAWSENVGWIDFAPVGPPDLPNYSAKVDLATGDVSGWARALANGGGWDGWIKMRGIVANQQPTFASPVYYTTGQINSGLITIGDLNNGGGADLAVGGERFSNPQSVAVLLNNGDGTFAAPDQYGIPSGNDYSILVSLAMADIDGDGDKDMSAIYDKIDVSTGNHYAHYIIFTNNGNGVFTAKPERFIAHTSLIASEVESVALADLNADGKADMAVTVTMLNSSGPNLLIYNSNGDGTFSNPSFYSIASNPPGPLAISDLNADGKPDVTVTGSILSVFINRSAGPAISFDPRADYSITSGALAIGDLDKDGDADLAVRGSGTTLVILTNNGAGVFTVKGNYANAVSGNIAIGDLNADGKTEVVTINPYGNLYIFINNGDATFQSPITPGVFSSPRDLVIGNLNADAKVDIATAQGGGGIRNFINNTAIANYGVSINKTTGAFSGYAWADAVIGWIKFSGSGYGVVASTSLFNSPPSASISCDATLCPGGLCNGSWITYQPLADPSPCIYKIKNNSIDPDGNIASSTWYLNDIGKLACPGICDYTLQSDVAPADYTVKLRVEDTAGLFSETTHLITMKSELRAGFMCSLDNIVWQACEALSSKISQGELLYLKDDPSLAEFSAASQGAVISSRQWKINNIIFGGSSANPSVSATSTNTIRLTATDGAGRSDYIEHVISASLPLPEWKEISPF